MELTEWLAILLPVIVGLSLIALAILVARVGWQHRHNRFFSGLYLLSGLKSIGEGLFVVLPTGDGGRAFVADLIHQASPLFPGAVPWFYVITLCATTMLPLLMLFVLNFPRPVGWVVRSPRAQFWFLVPAPLVAALFIYSGLSLGIAEQELLNSIFNHIASALSLVAVFLLIRTRRTAQPIERKQAGYILAGLLPGFAITLIITFVGDAALLPGYGEAASATIVFLQGSLVRFASPILEFAAGCLVAFAILKYRILDFELQVKGGLRYVMLTVILGGILFAVEVYVGNFILQNQVFSFLGPAGSATLAGATGIGLFKPVHKMTGKITDRLFPEATKSKTEYAQTRSGEIYRAQATHILRDGNVSDREWSFLRTLRDQLGLKEAEARRIEEEVERSLGVDDARTGASSGTAPRHLQQAQTVPHEAPAVLRATPLPGAAAEAAPPNSAASSTDAKAE